jgi:GT2 family glycosyltransferase
MTDFELIVVDDGSTDDSAGLARRMGAVVVRHETPLGPAAARNTGAMIASALCIFFIDADVAVHPDTLDRGMSRFRDDPTLDALFGSYDDSPTDRGLVSQYRNLLHHFVHQRGDFEDDARQAHTFWTGCGMMRRDVFLEFGGFDPRLYPRPAIEDIELGYRLARAGRRIVLARDVQATHMKRWSLLEVIRTDVMRRGVPWALLIKRSGMIESDLNIRPSQKISVALTGTMILLSLFAVIFPPLIWGVPIAAGGVVALNREFYGLLRSRRGLRFAAASLPLHLIYFCCCGASVLIAGIYGSVLNANATSATKARGDRADGAARPIPRPNTARRVGRLARWRSQTESR